MILLQKAIIKENNIIPINLDVINENVVFDTAKSFFKWVKEQFDKLVSYLRNIFNSNKKSKYEAVENYPKKVVTILPNRVSELIDLLKELDIINSKVVNYLALRDTNAEINIDIYNSILSKIKPIHLELFNKDKTLVAECEVTKALLNDFEKYKSELIKVSKSIECNLDKIVIESKRLLNKMTHNTLSKEDYEKIKPVLSKAVKYNSILLIDEAKIIKLMNIEPLSKPVAASMDYTDDRYLNNLIKSGNVKHVRAEIANFITKTKGDKREMDIIINYSISKGINVWEKHDGKGTPSVAKTISDKFNYEKGAIKRNFSKERYERLIILAKEFYK